MSVLSNQRNIIGIVLVIVVIGGALMFMGNGSDDSQDVSSSSQSATPERKVSVRLVEDAGGRKWMPASITVKEGDKIILSVTNTDAEDPANPTYHRLVIDEFNIDTEDITPDDTVVIEFVADKVGEFTYYDPRPFEVAGIEEVDHSKEIGILTVE
tara:strand:- start:3027 stop:3491 length:465 start_codon:yes stop_codon:yes gene_type:complete